MASILSVLNQLSESIGAVDPGDELVSLTPDVTVPATTSLAAHQAMIDGMRPGETRINLKNTPVFSGRSGYVNLFSTLRMAKTYAQLVLQSQFQDLRFHDVADDVFDGGIKRGSRVLIRIVPARRAASGSWYEVARNWVDSTGGVPENLIFDKFSVATFVEPDEERYQIFQTFGADFIYGFGRRPRIFMLTGQILNGKMEVRVHGDLRSMDWKNAFQRRYEQHYRLSQCIKYRKKIMIYCQDAVYTGYLLNMQSFTAAETQSITQVTISFVLEDKDWPRNSDNNIPGFLSEGGSIVTNKTVPRDIFPEANLHLYIQESFIPDLENSINLLKTDQDEIIASIADDIDDLGEFVKRVEEAGMFDRYFSPAPGFSLHTLYEPKDDDDMVTESLMGQFLSYSGYNDIVIEKEKEYRLKYNIADPDPTRLVEGGEEDYLEWQEFQSDRDSILDGLEMTTNKLNDAASRLIAINREIADQNAHLVALRQNAKGESDISS
jgi:hypothetical protein